VLTRTEAAALAGNGSPVLGSNGGPYVNQPSLSKDPGQTEPLNRPPGSSPA
jgi:hypothetical protein